MSSLIRKENLGFVYTLFQNGHNFSIPLFTCKLGLKALANEDTLLPTQMFPRLPARATLVADTNFVYGTQKMFLILFRNILSATKVSQVAQPKKHHGQQCVRNNVSSFTRALITNIARPYSPRLKALANEDTLLRTHCCRHKCFPVCPSAQHLLFPRKLYPGC